MAAERSTSQSVATLRPMPWRAAFATVAAAALVLALPAAARPQGVVRNVAPQRTAAPADEQWPIYYPSRAHRTAAPARAADPMLRQFLDLHTGMRYERATQVARDLVDRAPALPESHYNLACALARLHRIDEALAALEEAVACGWRDAGHLAIDPDLAVVRRHERYALLLARVEPLRAATDASGPSPEPPPTDVVRPQVARSSDGLCDDPRRLSGPVEPPEGRRPVCLTTWPAVAPGGPHPAGGAPGSGQNMVPVKGSGPGGSPTGTAG